MTGSFLSKAVSAVVHMTTAPRSSLAWVRRGPLLTDKILISQTYWFNGALPRVPLAQVLAGAEQLELALPRAFDRKNGTSISAEEACHLAAIAKWGQATKALEIGTWDGNTALLLAANLPAGGKVVTVDLPPYFQTQEQNSLVYTEGEFNLTPRQELGRQLRGHPLSERIQQIYGDSAKLEWNKLGGPFGLIFIDGCHSEAYVRSDSLNALKCLSASGVIVWHDYGMIPEVSAVVDEIARENPKMRVYALEGTRLAVGLV